MPGPRAVEVPFQARAMHGRGVGGADHHQVQVAGLGAVQGLRVGLEQADGLGLEPVGLRLEQPVDREGRDGGLGVELASGVGQGEGPDPFEQGAAPRVGRGLDLPLDPLERRGHLLALVLVGLHALLEPRDGLVLLAEPIGVVDRPLRQVAVLRPILQREVLQPGVLGLEGLAQLVAIVQSRRRHERAAGRRAGGGHADQRAARPVRSKAARPSVPTPFGMPTTAALGQAAGRGPSLGPDSAGKQAGPRDVLARGHA